MSDLGLRAKGRWTSLLQSLGVDASFLTGRHGPCPVCGGKDRFRFDDRDGRGTFFCSRCEPGAGDGFALLQRVNGWDFARAAKEVEAIVGSASESRPRERQDPKKALDRMRNIWKQSHRLEGVEATRRWWMNRVGEVPSCEDLRGVDELYHWPSKRRLPGQIALVRGPDGEVVNMHSTFLTSAGAKAGLGGDERLLQPLDLPPGSAVRLCAYEDVLGIAEGIETAAAVRVLTGTPCWATMTATNMARWIAPAGVKVVIFADNDDSFTGAQAAFTLARRLRAAGTDVDVQIPGTRGDDWNDVLIALSEMRAA